MDENETYDPYWNKDDQPAGNADKVGQIATVHLLPSQDIYNRKAFASLVNEQLDQEDVKVVVLDLGSVNAFDTTFLGGLVDAVRKGRAAGKALRIASIKDPKLLETLRKAGLESVLGIEQQAEVRELPHQEESPEGAEEQAA